jgi:hypothetical protein
MTVRELCERMDSRELSEWMAYTRYFVAIPDPWLQTGLLASIASAPYTQQGHKPLTAGDYVPTMKPPQHESQDKAAIEKLRRELGIVD